MSNVAASMGCSPDKGHIHREGNIESGPRPPATGEIRMAFWENNRVHASASNDGAAGPAGNEGVTAPAAVPVIEGPLSAALMGGLLLDSIFWMVVPWFLERGCSNGCCRRK